MRNLKTITQNPEPAPPALCCPECYTVLTFINAIFSGRKPGERWDLFECQRCHLTFDYRHRTQRLRKAQDEARGAMR